MVIEAIMNLLKDYAEKEHQTLTKSTLLMIIQVCIILREGGRAGGGGDRVN